MALDRSIISHKIKIANEDGNEVSPEGESNSRPSTYQVLALPLSHPGKNVFFIITYLLPNSSRFLRRLLHLEIC